MSSCFHVITITMNFPWTTMKQAYSIPMSSMFNHHFYQVFIFGGFLKVWGSHAKTWRILQFVHPHLKGLRLACGAQCGAANGGFADRCCIVPVPDGWEHHLRLRWFGAAETSHGDGAGLGVRCSLKQPPKWHRNHRSKNHQKVKVLNLVVNSYN